MSNQVEGKVEPRKKGKIRTRKQTPCLPEVLQTKEQCKDNVSSAAISSTSNGIEWFNKAKLVDGLVFRGFCSVPGAINLPLCPMCNV